jgi:hypothetical protein
MVVNDTNAFWHEGLLAKAAINQLTPTTMPKIKAQTGLHLKNKKAHDIRYLKLIGGAWRAG